MMTVLHPTYTLAITIQRPDGEPKHINAMRAEDQKWSISYGPSWDTIQDGTGCDQVLSAVREALAKCGLGPHIDVRFERYEQRSRCA